MKSENYRLLYFTIKKPPHSHRNSKTDILYNDVNKNASKILKKMKKKD